MKRHMDLEQVANTSDCNGGEKTSVHEPSSVHANVVAVAAESDCSGTTRLRNPISHGGKVSTRS